MEIVHSRDKNRVVQRQTKKENSWLYIHFIAIEDRQLTKMIGRQRFYAMIGVVIMQIVRVDDEQ